jgi:hypothetical protein
MGPNYNTLIEPEQGMEREDLSLETSPVPRVLLTDTTRWALASRLAIGLAKVGFDVFAVCPTHHPLLKTRAVRQKFSYSGLRPLDSLVTAIEATKPQVVIPCDDRSTEHLHELHAKSHSLGIRGRDIAGLIERSLGTPKSYAIVSTRYDLLTIARKEGLRVPDTELISTVHDLRSWLAGRKFPCVLKADGTFGGLGVKIAHTPSQAERSFFELTRRFSAGRVVKRLCVNRDSFWLRPWWNHYKPAIIVQSHINGRPANCGVVCWEGRVLGGIGVEVVSADAQTGPASVVRIVDNPEMMCSAEQIARRLGVSGFFGLDFIIEDGSGAAHLIEMNPRCTPLCHLQLGKGRDMIEALWGQLSGQPFRETPPVTRNDMIAYFPQAWNNKSEFLESSFQDVPQGEPELVEEILRPWPDRSLLFRAANYMHHLSIFTAGVLARKPVDCGGPEP